MSDTTAPLDTLSAREIVERVAAADAAVPAAVAAEAPRIAALAEAVAQRIRRGGRLIYVGAGTSGRLGALDAAEIPPTFGVPPGVVLAVLAGGDKALRSSVEGAEDDADAGARALADLGLGDADAVLGIAASGSTPFVLGALRYAREQGALAAGLTCAADTPIAALAEITIAPLVGPEVLRGSTRMKAGTAQKLALNTLSTTVMTLLGHTYGDLMVDVQPLNEKLRRRVRAIVSEATGLDDAAAAALLESAGSAPVAITMALAGVDAAEARRRLVASGGHVRAAISGDARPADARHETRRPGDREAGTGREKRSGRATE
jgi:N-acetylmuramic acid 6-phosphate etherase